MQRSLLLTSLYSPPHRQWHSQAGAFSHVVVYHVGRHTHLSSSGGPAAKDVSHALDPTALGAEGLLSGRGVQRIPQEKVSAPQGMTGRCLNHPPPTAFLRVVDSPSLFVSLLPGAVPAGICFSVPTSLPRHRSQTPSHPLRAQLCPADASSLAFVLHSK